MTKRNLAQRAPASRPIEADLGNGLRLRQARGRPDLEAVLRSHLEGFGDEDELTLAAKLFNRPGGRLEHVLLVEDGRTGQVVSSVSLVLQTWSYEGLPIPIGEVGIVSTCPAYRKRGLVRAQFAAYHRLALRAGCALSIIAGIPYFYRQFGYDYALPMPGGWVLRAEQIPDRATDAPSLYTHRPVQEGDWPFLLDAYRAETRGLGVSAVLTEEVWRYQDGMSPEAEEVRQTWVVERDGAPCGYWRINRNEGDWDKGVVIKGAYAPTHELALEVLHAAKELAARGRQFQQVRVATASASALMRLAEDLGGERRRPYGWLMRVLDPVRLMSCIAPALERRLADSPYARLTDCVQFGLFRERLSLHFAQGRLTRVALAAAKEKDDLHLPPEVAPMLWLGYRDVEQILAWCPDANCTSRSSQRLVETLFPQRPSWAISLF